MKRQGLNDLLGSISDRAARYPGRPSLMIILGTFLLGELVGVYDVFFCFDQIGHCELWANMIRAIVSRVGLSVRRVGYASKL
jgi:hypothetical protein